MSFENITLRPYQKECKISVKQNFDKGVTKQLICVFTGGGKRLMSLEIGRHFKGRKLFIAHRQELIMQAYDEIEKYYPLQAGIIKGRRFEIEKEWIVASVQTLTNRLDKIPDDYFEYIITDECHHFLATSFIKVIRYFQPRLLTGWSATPYRADNLSMSDIFDKTVFEYGIQEGVSEGWLARPIAHKIQTAVSLDKARKTAGDFNQKDLSDLVDCELRNELVVQKYRQYLKNGEQAVAFCVDIEHAYNLRDKFREYGISAETIVSDTARCPNREELFKRFENKDYQILCNVNIATEGWDYSDVAAALMVRPTMSKSLFVQMVGRVLRLKSEEFEDKYGHSNAIILDFVDNSRKHSLINTSTLEDGISPKDKVFLNEKEKKAEIEAEARRMARIEAYYEEDSKIDLIELPDIFISSSPKMKEQATEAQIEFMKNLGVYVPGNSYTKGQASELISNKPAESWQIKKLAKWGYDVTSGVVTIGQFQAVKRKMENKNKYRAAGAKNYHYKA